MQPLESCHICGYICVCSSELGFTPCVLKLRTDIAHFLCVFVQGDNNVMCLQTARFLLKGLMAVQAGHGGSLKGNSASYLAQAGQGLAGARCPVQVRQGSVPVLLVYSWSSITCAPLLILASYFTLHDLPGP
jgi:hypothetical protein